MQYTLQIGGHGKMIGLSILSCGLNTKCPPTHSFDDSINQSFENIRRNENESKVSAGSNQVITVERPGTQGGDGAEDVLERSIEVWDESLQYSQSFPDEYNNEDGSTATENSQQTQATDNDSAQPVEKESCAVPHQHDQACLGDLLAENSAEGSLGVGEVPPKEKRDDVVDNGEQRVNPRSEGARGVETATCQQDDDKKDVKIEASPHGDLATKSCTDESQTIPPYLLRETFSYLTRETKPEILKNSSRADILRSLMKRDQKIARRRQEALSNIRASANHNATLPGKKIAYSSNYINKVRRRSENQIKSRKLLTEAELATSASPTKLVEAPTKSSAKDSIKRAEALRSLIQRNLDIAMKRQQALQKIRERDSVHIGTRKLPGRKLVYPDPIVQHIQDAFNDENSVSSFASSQSTSSRLDRLYEKGKKDRRFDLERSVERKKANTHLRESSNGPLSRKIDKTSSKEVRQNTMYELIERNKAFAMKRRNDMERARKNAIAGPTIRACRDGHDDNDSVSVSSTTSSHSTLTSSSRLDRLYEEGKQKRRKNLKRSSGGKSVKENVLDVQKVNPTIMRCDNVYEISRRKHVMGRKRREDIANAKLEAMRALNQLGGDKEASVEKNIMTDKHELSTDWYFSNTSLKDITISREDEKSNPASGSNESNSSSDSNTENRYNYEDFILRNYQGNGGLSRLEQGN